MPFVEEQVPPAQVVEAKLPGQRPATAPGDGQGVDHRLVAMAQVLEHVAERLRVPVDEDGAGT